MHAIARWAALPCLTLPLLLAACAGMRAGAPDSYPGTIRMGNPISAYGVWMKPRDTVQTGTDQTSPAGMLLAQVYMQLPDHPLLAPIAMSLPFGWMVCPMMAEAADNAADGLFGRCTITTADEDRLFLEILCMPTGAGSCEGRFKVVEGTKRYRGAIGAGLLRIQLASQDIIFGTQGSEATRIPHCRLPGSEATHGPGFVAGQPIGLVDRGCRLEHLPFVPAEPAPHVQTIAMRE